MSKQELVTVMRKVSDEESEKVSALINSGRTPEEAIQMVKATHHNPEKPYILLAYLLGDRDDTTFIIKYTRQEIYDTIKDMVEQIDIHRSFVLTDSKLTIEEAMEEASVYNFMKRFQVILNDEEFDIEDYNELIPEEE